ncbi:MAG TPA: outer membrane protein assembly factor BamD, partial [Steroidobacteraceae bacterium]|nr:outer membrane protein assembly factor BamD [Steroidobacteraceae bacterium]
FATVVEQFPNSEYAHDARRRMVYLRNRLADYEIAVANYYVARGAYVAAAQRAKVAIEEFDGSPAVREALEIMVYCYDQMELKELAAQTRAMYRQNFEGEMSEGRKGSAKKKWYKLWLAS